MEIEEYRTPDDVFKELAKAHNLIGSLMYELQRMYNKSKKKK
jgi:hypothetical protein